LQNYDLSTSRGANQLACIAYGSEENEERRDGVHGDRDTEV
jgi:hypothetical protein